MSSSQAVMLHRQKRKQELVQAAGGCCNICGYLKCIGALEFHHIDPLQKKYGISSSGNCHSLEQDLEEIKKCILVCANCHREIHSELYSQKELLQLQKFDEEYILSLLQSKEKATYFCTKCGTEITRYSQSGLCATCSSESKRAVVRPCREELKELIRILPFTKIGEKFGVTNNAIVKWCKAEKLPFRKKDIILFSDEEWSKV